MPRRIAMVIASPFPANHGTPGSIKEMAEALARAGHEVHAVTYHFGAGPEPQDVQIHRVADCGFSRHIVVGPTWQKPLLDGLMVVTLCRVIRREGIDLIHAHNYEGAVIGYLAHRITQRPLVYNAINTMRDELPTYNFFKPRLLAVWLAQLLDYWVPRTADQIIAISQELVSFLLAQGIPRERLQMIPLGIDTTPFQACDRSVMRQRYHVADKRLVMYTGILDQFQRLDYVLKAMRLVVDTIAAAHLFLVTNLAKDQDLRACTAMIQDLDLQAHVEIIRHETFAEIPLFLAAADVTVVCRPQCPGFPVKLLNYMAAGKPIVVSEGSAKGLRHMQQAFVVPDHDWRGLGHGIITLLHDSALAQTLGQQARHWVDAHLSWPTLVQDIDQVYAAALASSKRTTERYM